MTAALAQLGISGISALMGRDRQRATPDQIRNQQLIEQILQGIQGEGPFADIFQFDEDVFQRSFVDPAKSRFKNQIAPQIQQSFLAGSQQGGTGLEDTLSRAGVDMDQLLNQQFAQMLQSNQQLKGNALSGLVGQQTGVPGRGPSVLQSFFHGIGGGLAKKPGKNLSGSISDFVNRGFANNQGSTV